MPCPAGPFYGDSLLGSEIKRTVGWKPPSAWAKYQKKLQRPLRWDFGLVQHRWICRPPCTIWWAMCLWPGFPDEIPVPSWRSSLAGLGLYAAARLVSTWNLSDSGSSPAGVGGLVELRSHPVAISHSLPLTRSGCSKLVCTVVNCWPNVHLMARAGCDCRDVISSCI